MPARLRRSRAWRCISIRLATLAPLSLVPAARLGVRLLIAAVPAVVLTAILIWAGYSGTAATRPSWWPPA